MDTNYTEFYGIINNTIAECTNSKDNPVNIQMHDFRDKIKNSNQSPNIFTPTLQELNEAVIFCDCLDDVRLSLDVYLDDTPDLSPSSAQKILEGFNRYREYILPQNQSQSEFVIDYASRTIEASRPQPPKEEIEENIPPFETKIRKYEKQITDFSETFNKNNKKAITNQQSYSLLDFLNEVIHNQDLTNSTINYDRDLKLYSQCLDLTDNIPFKHISRTRRYELKETFNRLIANKAKLGKETYLQLAPSITDTLLLNDLRERYKKLAMTESKARSEIQRWSHAKQTTREIAQRYGYYNNGKN